MTRNDLITPTEASPPTDVLERLALAVEVLVNSGPTSVDLELKCYTPAEAADVLGKTENWVVESIQAQSIPFTRVGKSPRLTAAHIREIAARGEVRPNKFSRAKAA